MKINAYHGWGFDVTIPKTVTVSKKNPVEDFEIYSFKSGDETVLFAYSGNHPGFSKYAPDDSKVEHLSINGLNAKLIKWKDYKGLFYSEVLIKLSGKQPIPQLVHLWYHALSEENKILADGIIRSINAKTRVTE